MIRYDVAGFGSLIRESFFDPAAVARAIVAERFDREVLWMALLLVTVASVLISALTQGLVPVLPVGDVPIRVTPFAYATILGASLVLMVFGLFWTGRALGGAGEFTDTLALVVWLEVLAITVRLAQSVAMLFGPMVGGLLSLAGLLLLLWCLIQFVNVLHRFDSLMKSVLTLALALLGIGVGISLILGLIGVGAQAGGL